MKPIRVTKHISAPRERVFQLATDFGRLAEFIDGIDKSESLTEGPVRVGSRFRETRIMFGKEATEEMEITAFDEPHGYVVEGASCGAHFRTEHKFVADIAGTSPELWNNWKNKRVRILSGSAS